MDIIEPVTDSDQVRIFTTEVVRELIKGLTIRECYPKGRIRSLTVDDTEVHVFRKKKGRRSSGELLIIKGGVVGARNSDFTFIPNSGRKTPREYQEQGYYDSLMDRSDEAYKRDFYADIANMPAHITQVSITHDFKSFSMGERYFTVSRNRHYKGKRVIYSYKPSGLGKIAFFKQGRKGTDSYYLKRFGSISIKAQENSLAFTEVKKDNEMVESLLKVFFNDTECQDTESFYNQKAFPVITNALKASNPSAFPMLNYHPGWMHEENTLTQAINKSIGSKPRKDFVREIGRIARLEGTDAYSTHSSDIYRRSVNSASEIISGALFLASLSQYADLGFDVQDTIVKRLQKVRTIEDMAKVPFRTLSYENTSYTPQKTQNVILTCIALHKLGPTLSRNIFMGELGHNDILQTEGLTVMKSHRMKSHRDFQEIGALFLSPSSIDTERIENIIRNKYSGKRNIIAWIQEAKEAVDEIPFEFKRERNNFDFDEHNYPEGYYLSPSIVHDIVMRAMSRIINIEEQKKRMIPFPSNPLSDYINKETVYNNEAYSFIIPKNPAEVSKWANNLNNCMSGYSRRVVSESYAFVFVKKNNKPYAALGLIQNKKEGAVSYRKEQFYRKNNLPLPKDESSHLWKEMFSIEELDPESREFSISVGGE